MGKFVVVIVSIALFLAGCSSAGKHPTAQDAEAEKKEPVTLNVLLLNPALPPELFQTLFAEPMSRTHPHISFNVLTNQPNLGLNELIAAGEIPDLVYTTPYISNIIEMQYPLDLREQIAKHGIDLSRINPVLMEAVKNFAENGEIYSIPFMNQSFALWYNKSIFDKFGVGYPRDGMTWDEAIDLAKKVTRLDNGVQYRGLVVTQGGIGTFASSLSIELVDPKTETAIISDAWAKVFRKAMDIYEIPGNRPAAYNPSHRNLFLKDRTLAMAPFWTGNMLGFLASPEGEGMDWDVVQAPYFEEAPNKYYQADYHQFLVSRSTKHLDEAMEVLKFAISDEVQTKSARLGKETVLNNPAVVQQFAADLEVAKGKNIAGIFKSSPSRLIRQSKYNDAVMNALNQAFQSVFRGEADINSALRKAQEEANKQIEALKQ